MLEKMLSRLVMLRELYRDDEDKLIEVSKIHLQYQEMLGTIADINLDIANLMKEDG